MFSTIIYCKTITNVLIDESMKILIMWNIPRNFKKDWQYLLKGLDHLDYKKLFIQISAAQRTMGQECIYFLCFRISLCPYSVQFRDEMQNG